MRKKVLLGITKEKDIVFGEVEITYRNGYREFAASFDVVTPFENVESDGIEYCQELLNNCYDDNQKYNLCKNYDCTPSELAERMAEDGEIETLADERDCSLYSERIEVDGTEFAFESSTCGQYDIFESEDETIIEFTDEESVKKLYDFWQKYHLKEITEDTEAEILQVIEKLENIGIENTIEYYVRKYIL